MSDERDVPRSPAEREIARRNLYNPGVGRPLSDRSRQAQRTVEAYLTASAPPRWMERVMEIDRRVARERRLLEEERDALRARCGDDAAAFARRWRELAHARDYRELNVLIRQHNDWYPIERDLPVDPRTGEYRPVHGRTHRRPLLGPQWVLEQFPAQLD